MYIRIVFCLLLFLINQYSYGQTSTEALAKAQENLTKVQILHSKEHIEYSKAALDLALLYYQDKNTTEEGYELAYEALRIARKEGNSKPLLYLDLLSKLPKNQALLINARLDLVAAKTSDGAASILYAEKLIQLSKASINHDTEYQYAYDHAIKAYQILAQVPLEKAKPVYEYANQNLPSEIIKIIEQEIQLEQARAKNNPIELADALAAYAALGIKYQNNKLVYIGVATCYIQLKEVLQIYAKELGKTAYKYQEAYKTFTEEMQNFYPIEKAILDKIERHETSNDSFVIDFRKYLEMVDTIAFLDYSVEDPFQWVLTDLEIHHGGTSSKYYVILKDMSDKWALDIEQHSFLKQKDVAQYALVEFGLSESYAIERIKEINLSISLGSSETEIIKNYRFIFNVLDRLESELPLDAVEDENLFQKHVKLVVQPYRMFLIQEHNLGIKKKTYGFDSDTYLSAAFEASYYYLKDSHFPSLGKKHLLNALQWLQDDKVYLAEKWLDSLLLYDGEYIAHMIQPILPKVFPLVNLKRLLKAPLERIARKKGVNNIEYYKLSELIADGYFFSKNNPKQTKESFFLYKKLLLAYNNLEGKAQHYKDLLHRIIKNIVKDNPWSVEESTFFFEELLAVGKQYELNTYPYYVKYYADWHYKEERIISAESYYQLFIKLYQKDSKKEEKVQQYIEVSYNLARIYRKTGRPNKAFIFYTETLKLSRATYQEIYTIKCLDGLGLIRHKKGDSEDALQLFNEALMTLKRLEEDGVEDRYNNLKIAFLYVTIKRHIARVHLDNGYIIKAEKDYNTIKEFERDENSPIALRKDIALHYDLAYLAEIKGDSLKAIRYYQSVIRQIKDQGELAQANVTLANFYQQQGKDTLVAIYLKDALAIDLARIEKSYNKLAEKERLLFLSPISKRLNVFFNFALPKQDSTLNLTAFNAHLTVKGLSLETSTNLQSICNRTENTLLKNKCFEMQSLRKTLAGAATLPLDEQEVINAQIIDLEKEIGVSSIHFKKHFDKYNKNLDFYQLKQILKKIETKDSAAIAIDFLIVDQIDESGYESSVYYAAIIGSSFKMPIFIRLATTEELQDVLRPDIAPNTINYITDEFESYYLYELIWEPLLPYISDTKRLYICPSGILSKIAFGTLRTSGENRLRIMDKWSIHYYSSLRDLLNPKVGTLSEGSTSVGLVGGVKFTFTAQEVQHLAQQNNISALDLEKTLEAQRLNKSDLAYAKGEKFKYLPGTLEEVNAITTIFPDNWVVNLLSDTLATEENFAIMADNSPTILHLATHGYFFPKPPKDDDEAWLNSKTPTTFEDKIASLSNPLLRSGLALAGINRVWEDGLTIEGLDDGILTALEVANMDLFNTDLVVLSACETGRGDIDNNEGIMGLRRAFKTAGAKQLLLSLWKVPDKQTAELMQLFYTAYINGKSAHQAFEEAQESMRKRYKNPYYWAAFLLIE